MKKVLAVRTEERSTYQGRHGVVARFDRKVGGVFLRFPVFAK